MFQVSINSIQNLIVDAALPPDRHTDQRQSGSTNLLV